jgi:hypothetical protein
MGETRSQVLDESRRKGFAAGAAAVGTVALAAVGWPIAATVAAVPAAVLSFRWWQHRAKNGIRF